MVRIRTLGHVWQVADGYRLEAPASGLEFRVGGGEVSAVIRDAHLNGTANWLSVWVDGAETGRFRTRQGCHAVRLASIIGSGSRTVRLVKDTEDANGPVLVESLHAGAWHPAPAGIRRRIAFIGDSITCGYGADTASHPCGTGAWYDASRACLSYASEVGRRLEADVALQAVSGIGVARNHSSESPTMLDRLRPMPWPPDLIVVALGTNDFLTGPPEAPRPPLDPARYEQAYGTLVERLRSAHPKAAFLHVCSPMLDEADEGVQAAVMSRLGYGPMIRFPERYVSGCAGHPDLREHRLMADAIEPVVRRLLVWPA